MRGYDEGVSAQIPLKLNTHVFLCASICVCIGLPRLVRTVINPASLKGDSSLKPRSLGPPTIVVSFLSHTRRLLIGSKFPQLYLDINLSFLPVIPFAGQSLL